MTSSTCTRLPISPIIGSVYSTVQSEKVPKTFEKQKPNAKSGFLHLKLANDMRKWDSREDFKWKIGVSVFSRPCLWRNDFVNAFLTQERCAWD